MSETSQLDLTTMSLHEIDMERTKIVERIADLTSHGLAHAAREVIDEVDNLSRQQKAMSLALLTRKDEDH